MIDFKAYEAIQTTLIKKSGMSKYTVVRTELERLLDDIDEQLDEVILGNM